MDNDSLKGSPMHMAHHMVKAYGINEDCTYFAIAEPAFYGKIKQQQRDGRPKKQNIWNTPTILSIKDKNRIYFELVDQTLLTYRHLFWNFNPNSFAIVSNNSGKGVEDQ